MRDWSKKHTSIKRTCLPHDVAAILVRVNESERHAAVPPSGFCIHLQQQQQTEKHCMLPSCLYRSPLVWQMAYFIWDVNKRLQVMTWTMRVGRMGPGQGSATRWRTKPYKWQQRQWQIKQRQSLPPFRKRTSLIKSDSSRKFASNHVYIWISPSGSLPRTCMPIAMTWLF